MTRNPERNPVPVTLVTPSFRLHRQRPGDNLKDYDAVMASKALLRTWSDSPWPEDDFSLQQNAEDLAGHIEDFGRDLAYGFSIFTPDESRLIGSLYLDPVAPFLDDYAVDETTAARLLGFDVRLEYWLRRGTKRDFEEDFVREVLVWLKDAWWFHCPVFGSRRAMTARRALYEALGLKEVAVLMHKVEPRRFHFHA